MNLLDEMIETQTKKMLEVAQDFIPHITADDLLQPMDFPELEHNPHFRYEEGILAGMQMARHALIDKILQ